MQIRYRRARWWNLPQVWIMLLIIGVMLGGLIGHHVNSLVASRQRAALLEQIRALESELDAREFGNFKISREVAL